MELTGMVAGLLQLGADSEVPGFFMLSEQLNDRGIYRGRN